MQLQRIVDAALAAGTRAFGRWAPAPSRLGVPLAHAPVLADPVVLVPGFANDASMLQPWRRSLQADGFNVATFDDPLCGLGDIREAATRLGAFIADVQRRTHASKVDVVTFSAGNTVARAWMQLDGGAASVDSLVVVDGSWHGDDDSRLLQMVRDIPIVGRQLHDAFPTAYFDLQKTSQVMRDVAAVGELPTGVRVTAVMPLHAVAADTISGARNIVLRDDPSHIAMVRSSTTAFEALRGALLR